MSTQENVAMCEREKTIFHLSGPAKVDSSVGCNDTFAGNVWHFGKKLNECCSIKGTPMGQRCERDVTTGWIHGTAALLEQGRANFATSSFPLQSHTLPHTLFLRVSWTIGGGVEQDMNVGIK